MSNPDLDALDQADMARLVEGHDASLNDLMERHAQPVFHFLCRMLGNEDDANDLAQETFVRVYSNRDSFRAGAKFSTWLYTIAANLARNHLRWRSHRQHDSLDAPATTESNAPLSEVLPGSEALPSGAAEAAERAAAVRTAVAELPEELRESVVLAEWEDKSIAETATILKLTPKAVESRLYRARQQLRRRLRRWL